MLKKLVAIFFCATLTSIACAETCPDIGEMKNNNFHGWTAYDSDNGSRLPQKQLDRFRKQVDKFTFAEWADEAPEGESHCYYGDRSGEYMFAFLAKENLHADRTTSNWKEEGGFLRCHGAIGGCLFI